VRGLLIAPDKLLDMAAYGQVSCAVPTTCTAIDPGILLDPIAFEAITVTVPMNPEH
jgi:hypothetical protein